jgi:cyclic-di-AMP phosphodiesterase PgpH
VINRPTAIRVAVFLAVVVAVWSVLTYGTAPASPDLRLGEPAPLTYIAESSADVVDVVATEEARQAARDAVVPIREPDREVEASVNERIRSVFETVEELVVAEPPPASAYEMPELAEPAEGEEPFDGTVELTGRVFLDVDGDGVFSPEAEGSRVDQGASRIMVQVETADGTTETRTAPDGTYSLEIESLNAVVSVGRTDTAIPTGWIVSPDTFAFAVSCEPGASCVVPDISLVSHIRAAEEVEDAMAATFALPPTTISYLVATASEDVIRSALGQPEHLGQVLTVAVNRAYQEFSQGIEPGQLPDAQARVRASPPPVFFADGTGQDFEGGAVAGDIVATYLQANFRIDQEATDQAREEAAAEVEPVTVSYVAGEVIVTQNTRLTQLHIDAIAATTTTPTAERALYGGLAVVAAAVGVIGLYLSRFRQDLWSRPRMVALLGIILVLAAMSIRISVGFADTASLYVVPAVAFGFITAVLFDQRIGILIAIGVGVLTALGTNDVGITVYASLAAMVPIPFVSAVSSRGAFRNAVILSSVAAALVAVATASAFHVGPNDDWLQVMGQAGVWAFGSSVVASLVGLAALQFFEAAFDITTTLRLLDLTDRNHEALQLLQEEAFGTFNHSLMVGTLADAAARAIGANALLARAMAYYHDLGKVENPTYFIENQFGMQNPHDFLEPKESADIIRSHVTSGVALARRFDIPSDVTQGIVSHHGDGVMRYFYEKARSQDGESVDVDDFRHIGHKPRTAETAILMLADSLEAACRAVFQTEEPTPDAIEKVVDRIVSEKVDDGQMSEAPLTLAELSQIRKAFLDSLVGHYHQRIAYPNFPGS